MSGLVGYVGHRDASEVILDSLERLEYRGYDSSGLAIISGNSLKIFRTLGRPHALTEKLSSRPVSGNIGIGHTRWATHGKPSVRNAHPQVAGDTAVVHNGILENAKTLRRKLEAGGVVFRSETDTEVLPHLINIHWKGSLPESVLEAIKELEDGFTCCVVSAKDPDCLVAVRKGNPLVVGLGEGELIVASDVTAVAPFTERIVFLNDGEMAVLSHEGARFFDFQGQPIDHTPQNISWNVVRSEKRGYRHYLLKEIVESPRAVRETIAKSIPITAERVSPENFSFPDIGNPSRVIFFGSGSSYFAAMLGQSLCESMAGVSTSRKVASEFRYGTGVVEKNALYVALSQSGESLDTLEAARFVANHGAKLLAVTNNASSSLARLADYPLLIQAGPEVSVVSSKTFSATIMALILLVFYLGRQNGHLSVKDQQNLIEEIRSIPEKMELTITNETMIRRLAEKYAHHQSFFFVGRGMMYPLCHYAALMAKEVVNVHGEGLLAGEFKHGAISLIEKGSPIMFFANMKFLRKQIANDMDELKVRGADIIATASGDTGDIAGHCDQLITVPDTDDRLAIMTAIAPAQLFIYYLGLYNRKDIDRPRNIAKSVTV